MRHALVIAAALMLAGSGRAEDWPEFRGPTGQGHVTGSLPTEWGPDKNITWKQEIPGAGWSSPVVVAGRVYLTTAVGGKDAATKDLSLRVLCLDAKDGKILWNVEAIHQPGANVSSIHFKNRNASPTPIVDGKRLYVHFGHLGTACLDLDGKLIWANTELHYQPQHGNGGSPILVDDLIVFSVDGNDMQCVVALDRATGKVRWKTDRQSKAPKKFSFHTPLLIEVGGRREIISSGSNVVAAYDPKTGAEIWRFRYTGYSVIPRPVYGHGLLFLSTSYDNASLLAIRADGNGDITDTNLAWTLTKNAPHTPSPLLDGDNLFIVSDIGFASCLDAKTGKVHWTNRLKGGFSASPILADGKVYFQNEDGTGFVVEASTKYKLLAVNEMNERTLASYAAADGAIFLRTAERLYRIDKK